VQLTIAKKKSEGEESTAENPVDLKKSVVREPYSDS
jgi:hypothetical protein